MSEESKPAENSETPKSVKGVVILSQSGRQYLHSGPGWSDWNPSSNGNSNQLRVWTIDEARKLYIEAQGTEENGSDGWPIPPEEVMEAIYEGGHTDELGNDIGTKIEEKKRFPIFDYLKDHVEDKKP